MELRWQSSLLRRSEYKGGDEQSQILFQKCSIHLSQEPPWWRNLASDGKSIFGISAETPCTEVTDDRDSTYYPGLEYSWAPTEKCMGKTFSFVSLCGPVMKMTCFSVTNPMT